MHQKDTIFLHIGMHKTATTSIQSSLDGFSDGVTRYARMGRQNHSVAMISAFGTEPQRHHFFSNRGLGADDVTAMRTAARNGLARELASPERNLILSGEAMVDLPRGDLESMRLYLEEKAAHLRVMAYVREPVGFAASAFQQQLKGRRAAYDVPLPKYRNRFARFLQAFGRNRVEFFPFDVAGFRNQCIITDFCDRVGIDADQVPRKRRNESLSPTVVALLLDWNRDQVKGQGSPARLAARRALVEALRKAFPGKFAFDPSVVAARIDPEDCAWMEARAGFALPAPPPAPADAVTGPEDLAARASASGPALAALLAEHGLEPPRDAPAPALLDALYAHLLANPVG